MCVCIFLLIGGRGKCALFIARRLVKIGVKERPNRALITGGGERPALLTAFKVREIIDCAALYVCSRKRLASRKRRAKCAHRQSREVTAEAARGAAREGVY